MLKKIVIGSFGLFLFVGHAEAACSWTTLANGTTADASQVMNDLNCLAPLANPSFTGNVGIGTTGPQSPLHISRYAGSNADALLDGNSSTSGAPRLLFVDTNGGSVTTSPAWGFNEAIDVFQIVRFDSISLGSSITPLTILNSGIVGIGTTTPTYTLQVNGSVAGASAYTNLSDERLKKDIQPIQNALQIIEQIHGVSFRWRTPAERNIGKKFNLPIYKPQVGFIAQDLEKVLPQAVSIAKGKDAIMSVEESKVVPVLVEAVKQLKAVDDRHIASLEREVRDLRQINKSDAARIQTIEIQVANLTREMETRTAPK